MADNKITVSGSANPYIQQSYTVEANDKNTLSMTDYFKLLAAQLQNQDMTNPMDNSEMMSQMVQMGMMQAITAMTDSMEASTATTAQTYAASLIGQEVTVMTTEESASGVETPVGVKYGKVEYVSFVNGDAKFKLEGDSKEYSMSYLVGVGKIPDPFKIDVDTGNQDKEDEGDTDPVEGAGGDGESTEQPGELPKEEESTEGENTGNVTDAAQEGAGALTDPDAAKETPATPEETEPTQAAQEGAVAAAGITE